MEKLVRKTGYTEKWLWNDEDFCAKVLCFSQGVSTSLHWHKLKKEHFLVKRGAFVVQLFYGSVTDYRLSFPGGEKMLMIEQGPIHHPRLFNLYMRLDEDLHIPRCQPHRIIGLEEENEMCEFSTTHDDQDSYRIDFKRSWTAEELMEVMPCVAG